MDRIKALIRDVPDFPREGILFKDITPVLSDPEAFRAVVSAIQDRYADAGIDKVVGIEARGFIFGAAVSHGLGAGFVPVRKPGKLPYQTDRVSYELEYGSDSLEMHADAIAKGERVLVVDDLLATGGTASATDRLVTGQGGEVVSFAFVIELGFLGGRGRLGEDRVFSLVQY